MRKAITRLLGAFADRSGASLAEFGLIGPILLAIFAAAVEIPRAYNFDKRLDQAASTLVDLLARQEFGDLQPVYAIVGAIADPYDASQATIRLTTGGTYGNGSSSKVATRVCSSAQLNGTARPVGSTIDTPSGQASNGDRFVMVEIDARYTAIISLFPALTTKDLSYRKILPARGGKIYNGQLEVVLPAGQPCPFA